METRFAGKYPLDSIHIINERSISVFDKNSPLLATLPFLSSVSPAEWAEARPFSVTFPAQARMFQKEEAASYGMFVLRGTARITLIEESGREAVIALLSAGEVCSLLVLSGLSGRDYPGSIIAETEVEALFIAKSSFLRWVQEHELVRSAIFGGLLDSMLHMVEHAKAKQSVPLETRLARALLRRTSDSAPLLHATHQELAAEIGSVREVVSRALRRFQTKGWIESGRGWLRIIRREELEKGFGD
ncbi:Crp/Fnr family transcriptional regulator [Paenibacillus thalictri]|uniref:Crp/Fnr family transcriptional regulator n=1 Tax=Paenibacillus thalictri TaxID=2527873 RepID=A0A4Q9DTK5_9BACL|nr:Crp/Fnr family transcriptional regulator [Paenibacillus thalictri]TBL79475.1 Crp/Fnr family transcriptional regulator [Paenibacillus thalictri]